MVNARRLLLGNGVGILNCKRDHLVVNTKARACFLRCPHVKGNIVRIENDGDHLVIIVISFQFYFAHFEGKKTGAPLVSRSILIKRIVVVVVVAV